jgi:tetratricopeptide (TPR) repeat protein
VRAWLADLPPVTRWALTGAAVLLVGLVIAAGVAAILQQRAAAARMAFAAASMTYRDALASREEAKLEAAARALSQYVADYSRAADVGQAWYALGNVEFERRRYDAALTAFDEAARRSSGILATLSRLGAGYAWEAKGDPAKALAAYQEALKGRGPKDFAYDELMVATGRVQEVLKQPAAAVQTYRQLLKEAPQTPRAPEVRTRLAILGAAA